MINWTFYTLIIAGLSFASYVAWDFIRSEREEEEKEKEYREKMSALRKYKSGDSE